MKRVLKLLVPLVFIFLFLILSTSPINATSACDANCDDIEDFDDRLECQEDKISCWDSRVKEAQQSATTLKNTISILNGQINVLQVQIDQSLSEISKLEKEILELGDRIEGLNYSLDKLTNVLVERVGEHYKRGHTNPLITLLSRDRFSTIVSEFKYLQLAKQQTANAMERAESQKITYDEQKSLKEDKQQELESKRLTLETQKVELAGKKAAEQRLLEETKNNEAIFQDKLSEAKAEFEALQDIIAGKGDETVVGDINKGDKIATVIQGASCNSSGTHLHFVVSEGGKAKNPFSYLKSGVDHVNYTESCPGVPQDAFNPSGSWDWPIKTPIKYTQSFGVSSSLKCNAWVAAIYPFHNGIDIVNANASVYSVADGTLYRGSYSGSGGCNLRYVRVDHEDDNISTFYLHVNY